MSNLPLPTPRDPKLKGKRIPVKAGGVFEIPTPDGRFGYGVIIKGGGVPYVIILKRLHDVRATIAELAHDDIAFVGWTMDALIYHGRWTIIGGGYPDRPDVPFPNFRVKVGGVTCTTDFTGKVLGPIRSDEVALLDQKWSRAAIAYQDALFALHGLAEWDPTYDKLTAAYARKRVTR